MVVPLPRRRGRPSRARLLDHGPPALAPRPSQEPSLASCCSAGPELPRGCDTRPITAAPSSCASSRPVSVQPPHPTEDPPSTSPDLAPSHALTATSSHPSLTGRGGHLWMSHRVFSVPRGSDSTADRRPPPAPSHRPPRPAAPPWPGPPAGNALPMPSWPPAPGPCSHLTWPPAPSHKTDG